MKIIGIDPGTTRVGYGLIKVDSQNPLFIDCGCLKLDDISEEARPYAIYKAISRILKKHKPDFIAIEKVFFSKNKKTAIAVSESRGAIMVSAETAGVSFKSYTPSEVKRSVSTHGHADKKGVAKMVGLLLGVKDLPKSDDAIDALAIAICCSHDATIKVIDGPNY